MRGRRLAWLLLGLCTAAVGCSDDPGAEAGGVRVKSFRRHVTATGVVDVPPDSSSSPVEMFRLEGEEYLPVAGTMSQAGTYVFKDAPEGTYYLRHGTHMFVTDAREVDLSGIWLGRPEVERLENELKVHVSVDGLEPWVNPVGRGSGLDFVAEQVDAFVGMDVSAQDGATSVEDPDSAVWMALGVPARFKGGEDDRGWILQRTPRTLMATGGGLPLTYDSVGRALRLPPLAYDGSGPLRLRGTLQPVPMKELALDWRLSAFTDLSADAHPAAKGRGFSFQLHPAPHGLAHGWAGYSGWLLSMVRSLSSPTIAGRFVYGNPYPSDWEEVLYAIVRFSVPVETVDGTPFTTTTSIEVTGAPSALTAKPLVPVVGPPRGFRVAGHEASASRTLPPGSVVVEWQPPALGTPNGYRVRVIQWVQDGASRFERSVLRVVMDGATTSVRIPHGTLVSGQKYLIRVEAIQDPGLDPKVRPFISSGNAMAGTASTVSGLLTIQ
ncbi:fibronectin type III domain-containing protein [Myxococcus stipitatus]|uniref:fibronectin type III domain-containing protein n=1 Tax=Myxococcus stipitatus TaxID=83455 RepID=UPI0031454FFF